MAAKTVVERWLTALTHVPTAPGVEHEVVEWVKTWVARRPDLGLRQDSGGNLLITQRGRKPRAQILAVAHMDHPAFVVASAERKDVSFRFRGGVRPEYFDDAVVELARGGHGRVSRYDPVSHTGSFRLLSGDAAPGDIARWRTPNTKRPPGRLLAPACDDLAGCAAVLAALDRARARPALRHFGVLLTRAEEMGFIGALHAAKTGSIAAGTRILSIETSRASRTAPIGGGPVIRVGDAATVFDHDLTNRISRAAANVGIHHQRQLMPGGTCEATAFGAYGYRAAGLCLALGNYHNQGNLDEVEDGRGMATPMLEEISLDDFRGLVDLLLLAAEAIDGDWDLPQVLESIYADGRYLLD